MINSLKESWKFIKDAYKPQDFPDDSLDEFVFWGRSNVGKSSLINALTQLKIAKTSKTPGRTKSIIFFELSKRIRFVDFPGYGYSKISKANEEKLDSLINHYLEKRKKLKRIFLLVDSRHGITRIDHDIMTNIKKTRNCEVCIIFTKTDKLKTKEKKNLDELLKKNHLNKNLFKTSIKESNGIVLLKKFLLRSKIT